MRCTSRLKIIPKITHSTSCAVTHAYKSHPRPHTQHNALYHTPQNHTQDHTLNIIRCISSLKILSKTIHSISCAVPYASKPHPRLHTQHHALHLTPQNHTQDCTLNIMRCTSRLKITPKTAHSTSCAAPHTSKPHPRLHTQHHALYLTPQNHTQDCTLNIMRCTQRLKITPKTAHSTSCAVPNASKSHPRPHTHHNALYLTPQNHTQKPYTQHDALYLAPQNHTQDHTLNIMRCTHASNSHPRQYTQHDALYLAPQNHTQDIH
ncbi:hypothetical protein PoB_006139900 [Plakobranchus ocellatus]|uniref:Uncharacterized protein n=1 Tax=Plakobranchus ocellatus TaxID=259542 RepID=A0AAV4CSM7_9GAST|nr:hypothetical protein PoB_006139900 [Plakobranchus ocellatus]